MPWNGSGTFTRQYGSTGWQTDAANGTKIVANRHDTNDTDIATGVNACLTRNNEAKPTANFLPNVDNSYALGSSTLRWTSGYYSTSVIWQGASFATTVTATPTANRAIVLPDTSGTVALTSQLTGLSAVMLCAAIDPSGVATQELFTGKAALPYACIVVLLDGISLSGAGDVLFQIGDDAGYRTTAGNYASRSATIVDAASPACRFNDTGFIINAGLAGAILSGYVEFRRMPATGSPSGDIWMISSNLFAQGTGAVVSSGGIGFLSSATPVKTLDRLRITTTAGTFDSTGNSRISAYGWY